MAIVVISAVITIQTMQCIIMIHQTDHLNYRHHWLWQLNNFHVTLLDWRKMLIRQLITDHNRKIINSFDIFVLCRTEIYFFMPKNKAMISFVFRFYFFHQTYILSCRRHCLPKWLPKIILTSLPSAHFFKAHIHTFNLPVCRLLCLFSINGWILQ